MCKVVRYTKLSEFVSNVAQASVEHINHPCRQNKKRALNHNYSPHCLLGIMERLVENGLLLGQYVVLIHS